MMLKYFCFQFLFIKIEKHTCCGAYVKIITFNDRFENHTNLQRT